MSHKSDCDYDNFFINLLSTFNTTSAWLSVHHTDLLSS